MMLTLTWYAELSMPRFSLPLLSFRHATLMLCWCLIDAFTLMSHYYYAAAAISPLFTPLRLRHFSLSIIHFMPLLFHILLAYFITPIISFRYFSIIFITFIFIVIISMPLFHYCHCISLSIDIYAISLVFARYFHR
jgi:hypothetical protein